MLGGLGVRHLERSQGGAVEVVCNWARQLSKQSPLTASETSNDYGRRKAPENTHSDVVVQGSRLLRGKGVEWRRKASGKARAKRLVH